ncbi:prostatic spermine-binding protein-like [Acomys russatus]|uniref:prostatic spermine-binding protein-like n=1 Tax=Acomys russatus TaxID=60746 RepID=UPI0021E27D62|nr:prostatic spermine-binding protein-like [Acomys russatus]
MDIGYTLNPGTVGAETAPNLWPKPSGAMLLLMTLAVLAISTCRAQDSLDNYPGHYFYVRGDDQGELKGIRVFLGHLDVIEGIQLLFGEQWSHIYGAQTQHAQTFLLNDGEHVIAVEVNESVCVKYLTLVTSNGRKVTLGLKRGNPYKVTGGPGQHLLTLEGKYFQNFCIFMLRFKWGPGPEDLISGKPEEPMVSFNNSKEEDKDEKDAGNGEDEDKGSEDAGHKEDDDRGDDDNSDNGKDSEEACRDSSENSSDTGKDSEEDGSEDSSDTGKDNEEDGSEDSSDTGKDSEEDGSEDSSDTGKDSEEDGSEDSSDTGKDSEEDGSEDSKEACKYGSEDNSN